MAILINMLNKSGAVKGQGVGSASEDAITLIKNGIDTNFKVFENSKITAEINHIHSINPSFYFKVNKMKQHGVVVGSVHFLPKTMTACIKLPSLLQKVFNAYIINFYKKMDYLVTVNPKLIRQLKVYGINENRITYIPNFVNTKMFYKMSSEEKLKLRKKYGIKKDAFTIVGAGQLIKSKGIIDFIKTAEKLKDCTFIWAGGFSFGCLGRGYAQIKKIVKNPPPNVKFLGIIERDEMNEIYNVSDVLFVPSYDETFGLTILEAMLCGIPVLVRDGAILKQLFSNCILHEKDVDGFAKKLTELKLNPKFYAAACEKAKEGCSKFSSGNILKMWQEFYGKLANNLKDAV